MKRVLFSPLFNYPSNYFTGDNVAHYHLGKYLWHMCNVKKLGFKEPIYHGSIQDDVALTFVFLSQQPQDQYFKKPIWIDDFFHVNDVDEINRLARKFDFFVNQYRYRGSKPPETNCGYSPDLTEINLHLPAITYKAVFEENLYIDDLLLSDKYAEFLQNIQLEIAPEGEPLIVLHNRGSDPWNRHQYFAFVKYEKVLNELLIHFPDHIIVLVGETWKYYHHPRVKNLDSFINAEQCHRKLEEYNSCLQYILSAYFCRNAEIIFIGISGFSLFIESIRPINLIPPIPVFWSPEVFDGECTCVKLMQKNLGWHCHEYEEYKENNAWDIPYNFGIHHFLYYSRNPLLLKPYCFDNPNTCKKILAITKILYAQSSCVENRLMGKKNGKPVKWMFMRRCYHFCYELAYYILRTLYRSSRYSIKTIYAFVKNPISIICISGEKQ